jgi:2-oxoisovalerate dehydrogenase E2 component (dihydrolipoyl transacylase)
MFAKVSRIPQLARPTFFNLRLFGQMVQIKLPDLGEGTKEATVKEWFVKEGDKIKEVSNFLCSKFDDLCEVFTDKLVAPIPSSYEGIVRKIHFKNDDICPVGMTLLDIETEDGSSVPESKPAAKSAAAPSAP